MTTSNYRPLVVEEYYREHKRLMEEAVAAADVVRKVGPQHAPATGNRAERRRQQALARKGGHHGN